MGWNHQLAMGFGAEKLMIFVYDIDVNNTPKIKMD